MIAREFITRCDICNREIGRGEDVYYECPDGLAGHDWLECEDCHRSSPATEEPKLDA